MFKQMTVASIKAFHFTHPLLHQVMISVFGFSPTCRYKISCTQYTIHQVEKNGTITGLKRGLQRILSCHTYATYQSSNS